MGCPRIRLSKSQFIKGEQCPLALWYVKHRKELIPEIDAEKQALFDTGHEVGHLAKQLFPDGVEITGKFYQFSKFVEDTRTLINQGATTIFEAAACTPEGLFSRIDILKQSQDQKGWDLIEVKSSTSVKAYHIQDMAVQRYTFEQAGFIIQSCQLAYVNNRFVKQGPIKPQDYFIREDITRQVEQQLTTMADKVTALLETVARKQEPDYPIGPHCDQPFECEFKHHCWKHIPDYSVYNVFKDEALRQLTAQNITRLQDVPDRFEMTAKQRIDIQAYKKNERYVDKASIRNFLDQLHYPLYFLDYETVGHALPLYDGSSPFQQVPFQFSLHHQAYPDGPLQHIEFLYENADDPRPALIKHLLAAIGTKGSILVYFKNFEAGRNKELAAAYPDYAEALLALNERMVDLWLPFHQRYLYSPAMKSSASIKKVLPAFVPTMRYDDLEIQEGGTASRAYAQMVLGKLSSFEKSKLLNNLKCYCEQDTLAMVKLLEILQSLVPPRKKPVQMDLFA